MSTLFSIFLGGAMLRRSNHWSTVIIAFCLIFCGGISQTSGQTVTLTGGTLTIDNPIDQYISVGADNAGKVTINGITTNYLAKNVKALDLLADFPDGVFVDLSGMTTKKFPSLRNTIVDTGIGNDTVISSPRNDDIFTDEGDDVIEYSPGIDMVDGGDGYDRLEAILPGGSFTCMDQMALSNDGANCRMICLYSIESLFVDGSSSTKKALTVHTVQYSGDVSVAGTPLNDNINTGIGDDFIVGGGGKDTITTNGGDDIVFASGGTISTGNGDDFVDASSATTGVTVNDGKGNDQYTGSLFNDKIIGFAGDSGNDYAFAADGSDTVDWSRSTSGNIRLDGGVGKDIIKAGKGDAILIGDDGDDDIYCGTGFNHIYSGNGKDFISTKGTWQIEDPENLYYSDVKRTKKVTLP